MAQVGSMSPYSARSINTPLLWGDFRAFLAGDEPTIERIAAFASKVDGAMDCDAYRLPVAGCRDAIVDELRRLVVTQA